MADEVSARCVGPEGAAPALSPELYASLRARLLPVIDENRREAGLPPLPADERAAWYQSPWPPLVAAGKKPEPAAPALSKPKTPGIVAWLVVVLAASALIGARWAHVGHSDRGTLILLALAGVAACGVGLAFVRGRERRGDMFRGRPDEPEFRLGACFRVAGLGVVIAGLLSRSLALPWGAWQAGLGIATFVVGHYLSVRNDLLHPDHPRCSIHRNGLAVSLVGLAALAAITATQFRPPGPDRVAAAVTHAGMAVGAAFAVVACSLGVFGVAFVHRPGDRRFREHPRNVVTRFAMTAAGLACVAYGVTHVVASLTVAPTIGLQVALMSSGAVLLLAALQTWHDPTEFARFARWVRWGLQHRRGCGRGQNTRGQARLLTEPRTGTED